MKCNWKLNASILGIRLGAGVSEPGGAVSPLLKAPLDHVPVHDLAVAHLAEQRHEVDECRRRIDAPSVLAASVVRGKNVVIVVEALSGSSDRDEQIFHGVDALVVRLVAPKVGHAVDAPSEVKNHHVAKDATDDVGFPQGFTPEVPGYDGR